MDETQEIPAAEIKEAVAEAVEEIAEEQQAEDKEASWQDGLALELNLLRNEQTEQRQLLSSILERLNSTPAAKAQEAEIAAEVATVASEEAAGAASEAAAAASEAKAEVPANPDGPRESPAVLARRSRIPWI